MSGAGGRDGNRAAPRPVLFRGDWRRGTGALAFTRHLCHLFEGKDHE